jgi:hypothetical protein
VSNPRHRAVHGIVSHDPSVPTALDQFVPRHDAPRCIRERNQHLHDLRFDRLLASSGAYLPGRGLHVQLANGERHLMRKDDAPAFAVQVGIMLPHENILPQHRRGVFVPFTSKETRIYTAFRSGQEHSC